MTETHEEYIGDGVYASFDGYHIWLRTKWPVNEIALEPPLLAALISYAERLTASIRSRVPAADRQDG